MTGFRNFAELGQAAESRTHMATWRKSPGYAGQIACWYDLSMAPGNPNPNYYASTPLISSALSRSGDGGINHGPNAPGGMAKYLLRSTSISLATTPYRFVLCDYLLYYPFVDTGDTSAQTMTNSVSLPRYTDGEGVMMIPVIVAPASGYTAFTVNYTNSQGVAGRVTPLIRGNIGTVNGYLLGSYAGSNIGDFAAPFLPLQLGDTGVRSIQSVSFSVNDVALVTFVLVKPLADTASINATGAVERTYGLNFQGAPKIEDDAYLNLLMFSGGAVANGNIHGIIETITN